jgi:fumarylacetoacetate (FAA) hydrolase family protein
MLVPSAWQNPLVNRVSLSNKTELWTFGISALISHLTR